MIPVGSLLAGKYRVDRVLGQGGMGVVVQAMHMQLHQPVAVKFLLPEILGNHEIVHRFLREAQAAVRLKSEHVARVIDVGTLETGAPYMVLEYLEGTDLAHARRHQLTPGVVCDLLLQACEALAEAHANGIIHRDIKPANFFITRRGDGTLLLKVLDFGISKSQFGTEGNLTATQSVMGTPAYMSPEQMRSAKGVDARSDIWSLGAVLYELLQGTQPFEADSFSAMCLKVAMDPHGPLTVPLPPGLDQVVYTCLAKDPAQRYQNVAQLAAALAPYAQTSTQAQVSVERAARTLGAPVPPITGVGYGQPGSPSTLSHATGARTGATTANGGRSRWPLVAGLAIVMVGGIVIAAVAAGGGGGGGGGNGAASAPPPIDAVEVLTAVAPIDAAAAPVDAAVVAIEPPTDAAAIVAADPPVDAGRRKSKGSSKGSSKDSSKGSTGGGDEDVLDTRY